MWEEAGRSLVVFGYIDSLQQAAEGAFGFSENEKTLVVPQDFMISLLDYDIKATQAAFGKETFDCGVCLDPKKGTVCHRMVDCGHVFCVQCLQDFYNNAITEGDLSSVRCLAPDCAKKREAERPSTKKRRKPKTQLSPSELLQIPLEHDMVTRYVKLKHKADLESDKNTVYCPRKWCQGAAKSKKHRKPDGFEDQYSSDDDSDSEENGEPSKFAAEKDLLAVCEDCGLAFCSRCFSSWHGEFTICVPKKPTGELTEEEKASLEYMRMHTTPCPTCASPAQKTHGCNHMICFKCHSHFCYLCSAWLSPANPYEHYNSVTTGCYMRLWELEGGDGDDVGIGFVGGVREVEIPPDNEEPEVELIPVPNAEAEGPIDIPEIVEPPDEPQQELQREGPLVLRINQLPPPPPAAPAVPDPPPAVGGNRRRVHGPHRRGPNIGPNGHVVRQVQRGNQQPRPRNGGRGVAADDPNAQEALDRAWIQMFVQMAMNDEEDQLEDDDEEDGAAWEIPVR
jgi:E3 ubiquitin-protein ligase RNF14